LHPPSSILHPPSSYFRSRRLSESTTGDLPAVLSSQQFKIDYIRPIKQHCHFRRKGNWPDTLFRDQVLGFNERAFDANDPKVAFECADVSRSVDVVLTASSFFER